MAATVARQTTWQHNHSGFRLSHATAVSERGHGVVTVQQRSGGLGSPARTGTGTSRLAALTGLPAINEEPGPSSPRRRASKDLFDRESLALMLWTLRKANKWILDAGAAEGSL